MKEKHSIKEVLNNIKTLSNEEVLELRNHDVQGVI